MEDQSFLKFDMDAPKSATNSDILNFDMPVNQSSYIKVIGVGGGGSNAVNHMYRQGIKGVDFIVCNTDAQALGDSPVPTKVYLGKGLGAGNIPNVAEAAALKKSEELKALFANNTQMLFITAGMGGGTGTGAAPVIAQLAKEIELDDEVKRILTVGIVTTPFSFEGRKRKQQAQEGIEELRKHVDAILIINNDKLREFGDLPMREAFAKADDILTMAAKGISEIITVSSYVQIDFKDVNTVMQQSGLALMGYGQAGGENRAEESIRQAINSPLLNDNNIKGAKNILLYISSGIKEVTMAEIDEITALIDKETGQTADVIWGAGVNEDLGEDICVTLVATGFPEKGSIVEPILEKVEIGADGSTINTPKATPTSTPTCETPIRKVYLEEEEPMMEEQNTPVSTANTTLDQIFAQERMTPTATKVDDGILAVRANTPEQAPISAGFAQHADMRKERLKNMSMHREIDMQIVEKVRTEEGLVELENQPAYLRRQVNFSQASHSSESEVSRHTLTEDGRISTNPYLHDNVD